MTATCDSPLEVAKERLRIPALWVILTLPGRPGRSCRSPFREDRNPSFVIFDNDRRFYDHGTGQAGDAVDFLAMALGISNGDASRKLIELAGVIPQTPHFQREEKHGSGDEMAEKARKRESWPTFDAPTGAEVKAIANCGAYPLKGSHLPQKRACCGAPIAMRDELGSSPIRGVSMLRRDEWTANCGRTSAARRLGPCPEVQRRTTIGVGVFHARILDVPSPGLNMRVS